VCDCSKAKPDLKQCKGPLCSLFKNPELPSMNFAMPDFSLPDIGPLIDLNSFDWSILGELFTRPTITLPKVRPLLRGF
jgi:hypothetical protein